MSTASAGRWSGCPPTTRGAASWPRPPGSEVPPFRPGATAPTPSSARSVNWRKAAVEPAHHRPVRSHVDARHARVLHVHPPGDLDRGTEGPGQRSLDRADVGDDHDRGPRGPLDDLVARGTDPSSQRVQRLASRGRERRIAQPPLPASRPARPKAACRRARRSRARSTARRPRPADRTPLRSPALVREDSRSRRQDVAVQPPRHAPDGGPARSAADRPDPGTAPTRSAPSRRDAPPGARRPI